MQEWTSAKLKETMIMIVFILFLAFLLGTLVPVDGDRGGFALQAERVSETGQKAIAAWNGTYEVLLLSTEVNSSQESEVIEIMPLPSNPSIHKGETNSFLKIMNLVNTFFDLTTPRTPFHYGPWSLGGQSRDVPAIEITFQEVIGAHDLTVIKAENADELIRWLNGFLQSKGYTKPLPSNLQRLLENYTTTGIKFFTIDMILTNSTVKTVEPLTYEFSTLKLYYPLRISTLFSGSTEISLFTLTCNELSGDSALTHTFAKRAQFQVKEETLGEISPYMAEIFSGNPYLCYFHFGGPVSWLSEDVLADKESDTNTAITAIATLIAVWGLVLLFLCFAPARLHFGVNDSSRLRRLQVVSISTGLIGAVLVCVGLTLSWGLAEFNQVLLPLNGIETTSVNKFLDFLFVPLVLTMICCYVYNVLVQGYSRKASVLLTVSGITTAFAMLLSSTYLVTKTDGFFAALTGVTLLTLTGILSRWRISLNPQQPSMIRVRRFKVYLIRKLLKALSVLFGISWVIFLIERSFPSTIRYYLGWPFLILFL